MLNFEIYILVILFLLLFCVWFYIFNNFAGKFQDFNGWLAYSKQELKRVFFILISPTTHTSHTSHTFKHEEQCRNIFEMITGKKFKKTRPDFLKYPTGKNLELDGYNKELNIAFEYNGIQHYEFTPFFHSNGIEDFYKQIAHDDFKKKRCSDEGIYLITIPYTEKDLYGYISSKLRTGKK